MKYLITLLLSAVVFGCGPRYGAHFQLSSTSNGSPTTQKEPTVIADDRAPVKVEASVPEEGWLEVTATSEATAVSPLESVLEKHNEKIAALNASNISEEERKSEVKKTEKATKKEFKRALKKEVKEAKANDDQYVLMMILGILIAPLGVGLTYGIGTEFWLSLVLFLLFWLPGAIYGGIKVHQFFRG